MKKVLMFMLVAILGVSLSACVLPSSEDKIEVQGITDTEIVIGNTAATSGFFATVGIPFNLAMQVVFDEYNATHDGRDIRFIHYDDEFNGETGNTLTRQLVEEDEVFALVGHFGTNTVNATMDYLLETGVPMVYGVTGVNSLYFENDPGNNILTVQPIYRTEGQMLVARTFHEALFGASKDAKLGETDNVVVLYSDDDAGQSIKAGIEDQVATEGVGSRVSYLPFNSVTASSVVTTALAQEPEAIILSANQQATAAVTALREQNSTVPVVTSYVNAAGVFTAAQNEGAALPFEVYANGWVDISETSAPAPTEAQVGSATLLGWNELETDLMYGFDYTYLAGFTAEYWEEFVHDLNTSTRTDGDTVARALWANSYAIAGYVAAKTFVTLLERVEDFETLTWASFIELAESAPVDLPMAGIIDWAGGQRVGLDELALNQFALTTSGWAFTKVREIESLATVVAK